MMGACNQVTHSRFYRAAKAISVKSSENLVSKSVVFEKFSSFWSSIYSSIYCSSLPCICMFAGAFACLLVWVTPPPSNPFPSSFCLFSHSFMHWFIHSCSHSHPCSCVQHLVSEDHRFVQASSSSFAHWLFSWCNRSHLMSHYVTGLLILQCRADVDHRVLVQYWFELCCCLQWL